MDCKVIYGFDLSLVKVSLFVYLLSESTNIFERRLVLVWSFLQDGFW